MAFIREYLGEPVPEEEFFVRRRILLLDFCGAR